MRNVTNNNNRSIVGTNAEKLGVSSDECGVLRQSSSLLLPRPLEHGANLAVKNCMNATHHGSVGHMDMQTLVNAYSNNKNNNNNSVHSLVNMMTDDDDKPIIRRLRSEGVAHVTLSSSDEDSLEAIMKPYLALDHQNHDRTDNLSDLAKLSPYQPTREHGREMSFTECGVDDVESIFAKRKEDSGGAFEKLPRRVPSIHLAKGLNSDTSSWSFDEMMTYGDDSLNFGGLKLSAAKSHDECVDSPKSAMDWLRQLQGEGQVAEAASSKFLTKTACETR